VPEGIAARGPFPAGAPGAPPEDAHTVSGRKGLLAKDAATRLALCAVQRTFGLPPGRPAPLPGADGTAVVVASHLGNVEAVCDIVDTVRSSGGRDVSLLAAPNASSNVIASTVAIRYGFTGPNLTLRNGAAAGLDEVRLGCVLLAAGRAHRVVVIGVEPVDPTAVALMAAIGDGGAPLRATAARVVLEKPTGDGVVVRFPRYGFAASPAYAAARPGPHAGGTPDWLGETYGAAGVLSTALASSALREHPTAGPLWTVCGTAADGYRCASIAWTRG
jgi:3-oxoacyl-[acyl-carrier-protein] synthase II